MLMPMPMSMLIQLLSLSQTKRCLISVSALQDAIAAGFELGSCSVLDLADRVMEYARQGRPVPMTPDRFEEFVRCESRDGRLTFTNGNDLTEVIIPQYAHLHSCPS